MGWILVGLGVGFILAQIIAYFWKGRGPIHKGHVVLVGFGAALVAIGIVLESGILSAYQDAIIKAMIATLWLAIIVSLAFAGIVLIVDFSEGSTQKTVGGIGLICLACVITLAPIIYAWNNTKSTLLDPGCYNVGIASQTTYALVGKVIVPIINYYNTFTPTTCSQ